MLKLLWLLLVFIAVFLFWAFTAFRCIAKNSPDWEMGGNADKEQDLLYTFWANYSDINFRSAQWTVALVLIIVVEAMVIIIALLQ